MKIIYIIISRIFWRNDSIDNKGTGEAHEFIRRKKR